VTVIIKGSRGSRGQGVGIKGKVETGERLESERARERERERERARERERRERENERERERKRKRERWVGRKLGGFGNIEAEEWSRGLLACWASSMSLMSPYSCRVSMGPIWSLPPQCSLTREVSVCVCVCVYVCVCVCVRGVCV
jgi:hypothetical protein